MDGWSQRANANLPIERLLYAIHAHLGASNAIGTALHSTQLYRRPQASAATATGLSFSSTEATLPAAMTVNRSVQNSNLPAPATPKPKGMAGTTFWPPATTFAASAAPTTD